MPREQRQRKPKKNIEIPKNQPVDSLIESISASMESENADIKEKDRKRKRNMEKPRQMSFGFLMLIGVPFSWSLVSGLISTTEFERNYTSYLFLVFYVVGILGLIFTYRIAIRTTLVLFAGFVLYTLYGFFVVSESPGVANEWASLLTNTFRYVIGMESHTMIYERVVVWIMIIAFSLFFVLFAYYRFNFIILFVVSAAAFSLLVTSVYFSYPRAFYVYIVCILTLVVRRMHDRSSEKTMRRSPYTRLILPITVVCFLLVGFLPMPEEGTMQGPVRNAIMRPLNYINDTFYNLTQRRDFSLRQIGFGGTEGRLGGAVNLNHDVTMRIRTDGSLPLYLTGATFDTYTGYSWRSTFSADNPVDFSLLEQNLELLERFTNTDVINSPEFTMEEFRVVPLQGGEVDPGRQMGWTRQGVVLQGPFIMEEGNVVEITYVVRREDDPSNAQGGMVMDSSGDVIYVFDTEDDPSNAQRGFVTVSTENLFVTSHGRRDDVSVVLHELNWSFTPNYQTIEVDVLNFRPEFVFHSGILQGITTDDENVSFLRDRDGRVTANRRFQRGSRYVVNYNPIDNLPGLDVLRPIHSDHGTLREVANNLRASYSSGQMTMPDGSVTEILFEIMIHLNLGENHVHSMLYLDLLNNYLIPRRDRIYDTYRRLPGDFPPRIAQLAASVTAGAENNYQKMRMLEEYLRQNYTYTLTPVNPPRDVDFVYHFLFDTREGHCVYFSTAFTTMARSLGMPARHVEGFLVNGVPNREGYINVLNSMAHAWPEVYFEGWGWHPFEPTPASGIPQLREIPEGADRDWNPMLDRELEAGMYEDWEVNPGLLDGNESNGEEGGGVEGAGGSEEERRELGFWGVVGLLLLAMMIMALLRALWIYWKNIGWRKKGNVGAVLHAFDSMLIYLKVFNYEMREGETVFRFMRRVCNKTFLNSVDEKKRLERTVEIYGKARYSGQEIERDERILVERTGRYLESRVKSHLGWPKYYFYRYILGVV